MIIHKMLLYKYLYNIYNRLFYIILFGLFGIATLVAQQTKPQAIPDTLKQLTDNQKISDISKDSISVLEEKNETQIDSEVSYSAMDSIVFMGNGTGYLYGSTDVKYQKINLKADFVRVKMDSSTIFASGTPDSLGVLVGNPVFSEENQDPYSAKELIYNLKSKKGIIRQAVTQQGEGYILSERAKKTESNEVCMVDGKYTTCEDHDHPHFYLSLSKAKVNPGNYVATGPAHMVLLDIPLPLVIPFGYFPFNSKYSSGVLMPSYVDEATYGFGLTNGGYYFALSDYQDLEIRGDIYTRGTWGVNISSNYLRRYKYNGNLSVTYRETVNGDKDLPSTYSKAKNLSVRWSHSQNPKVNPFRTLSASVNFSTSGYNRNNVNSLYSPIVAENTKSSSVSFSQRFPNNPFSISGSMQIDQRSKDSTMNLTSPNLSISMSRIYPLKRKVIIGKERWYEKISMSYSGSLSNGIYGIKENKLLSSSLVKDWKNGMQHSIPISASFNVFKYINFTASGNYNERWSLNSIEKSWAWNETSKRGKEVIDTIYGFKRNYNFNVGISASTIVYGFYTPVKAIFGDKILKIRHVATPSVGLGYNPDFSNSMWGFWDSYTKKEYINNQFVYTEVPYSKFEKTMYGSPGRGKSGSVNFSLRNNLEMKVKDTKDSINENATKIISLIDNFTINESYNMMADSMKWSMISTTLGIRWKWFTYSFNLTFDPYMWGLAKDGKTPVKINKLRWNNGKFPRFTGISIPFSYTLNNETFHKLRKKKTSEVEKNNTNINGENGEFKDENVNDVLAEQNTENTSTSDNKTEKDADGYEKISIPWRISLSYSVNYGDDTQTANYGGFDYTKMDYRRKIWGSVLNISGNIQLSKGWQVTAISGYDFGSKALTYTSFNVTRNLHCWTLTGSFVPIGPIKTYSFRIGVNASMLQDLKYEKQGNSAYRSNDPIIWY